LINNVSSVTLTTRQMIQCKFRNTDYWADDTMSVPWYHLGLINNQQRGL